MFLSKHPDKSCSFLAFPLSDKAAKGRSAGIKGLEIHLFGALFGYAAARILGPVEMDWLNQSSYILDTALCILRCSEATCLAVLRCRSRSTACAWFTPMALATGPPLSFGDFVLLDLLSEHRIWFPESARANLHHPGLASRMQTVSDVGETRGRLPVMAPLPRFNLIFSSRLGSTVSAFVTDSFCNLGKLNVASIRTAVLAGGRFSLSGRRPAQ